MKYCPKCGMELPDEAKFCGKCATPMPSPYVPPWQYQPPTQPISETEMKSGKTIGWAGVICGIIGLFVLNIILGPIAIVLGGIATHRKSTGLGVAGIVLGIVDIVLWILLFMWLASIGFIL